MKPTRLPSLALLAALALGLPPLTLRPADTTNSDPARDREMRDRYEAVLLKNPFQERAFGAVYEGYSKVEGVDQWIEALKPKAEKDGEEQTAALLLLGQTYDRQFKTAEAVAALEKAAAKGESRPQFKVLAGTLYYKAGRDEQAAELLSAALDSLTDLDQRSSVCRMLGNLYLRQGKRDQAISVWKRIAEQNPEEIFAQLELAEIYQDNRLWDQAIAVYRQIAELSKDDPYRRCRALRSIGQCLVQAEKFKDAIATYEQALELVAPGNWLFEDLKLRLVGVYEDIGDLAGLVAYVKARLEQNPGDIEFRDLLAETHTRMAKFEDAEKEYRAILERNPRSSSVHEKLLALHTRTGKKAEVAVTFEKLIELFPTDTDYLRRFGEFYVRDGQPDKAKETWRRLLKDSPTGEKLATLAGWFESYEFTDDAIATYQQALEKTKHKDWIERLAALKFQKGEEAQAVKLWLGVIDPATSTAEDYAEIAAILETNQKVDEAAKLRQAAVAKEPENLEARLAYAKILLRQQKYEAAAAAFEVLASQDKNEFLQQQGESGRIDAWRELGLLEDKQKDLERELTANPSDEKKLGQLARLYERAGQREKAVALYEARREKDPDNVEHLRSLATLYKNSKQPEQAIAAFKALLDKDKNRARVYHKELLDIYLSVDSKDEAIAAAEAYVGLAPGDPEAHLTLAQVYQLYRHPEKAFSEYRTALRLEPNEPDYHRQYGEALEQDKRYGEAQEAFRKMLDTAKEDTTRLSAVASLARIHLQQDRLAELLGEFQRRARNTPKKLAAYEELAAIYKEAGQIAKSVEILESGLQNVDDRAAALKALIRTTFEAQDFPKGKSYFEQLIAQSGKPTALEYERLGQIYVQLGELELAKLTWGKIAADAPKDPKAHDRLAQILRDAGFTDEALAMKARACELAPTDYRRRYEYAQLLAQSEQPVEALKELQRILELGESEEIKQEPEPEKKVQRVQKGQQGPGAVSPYQFVYGMRNYGGGYYGGGWQGTWKQFKPQLLMFMASVAQQSIGEDAFLEQLQDRVKKAKDNTDAKRDWLMILQMYNRVEDALKIALEILAVAPNDVDLLQQTALYYQNQQQLDQAIPLLERLAQSQPKYRVQALTGLVPLYHQNKQEDKALELADQLIKESPSDMQVIWAMGGFMQNHGKLDRARAIYQKALELDPNMKPNILSTLANLAQQEGKKDEAIKLWTELLTLDSGTRYAWMGPRRQQNLYVPPPAVGQQPYYGGPMRHVPPQVFGQIDWPKAQAIQQIKMAQKDGAGATDVFDQLEQVARGWKHAVSATERNKAWDTAKLLCAHWLNEKKNDQVADLLKFLRDSGMETMEWFNAAIYLAQLKEDYPGMLKLYDEVLGRFPAKARDVAQAKCSTLLLAKKYDEAAKAIRELNQQRVPPAMILGMIRSLITAGEKKLAKELLEEHLSGVSRHSEALAMLASLHGEENDYDQAIALANEAWERKAHGRFTQAYFYGPRYYYGWGGGADGLLGDLHRYYVAAGKSDELIARFKERLEKQPSSVPAHQDLAQIYRLSQERDKALEVHQQLAEKRPHLMQVKRDIASIYQETGDFKKATELYEGLLKTNPTAYQEISWELRHLYQRMGKGKELAQMEENLVAKAQDPYQARELADRFREDGELDKALALYQKAIKMSPGDPWMKNQLAGVFVQMGRLEEAVKLYEEWLASPQLRGQGWIDHNTLKQLVGLFQAAGRLQQLKARCKAELEKNPTDRTPKAMQVHLAVREKRFDEAIAGFKALSEGQRDPNGIYEIMELADITGNVEAALEVIEKSDHPNYWDHQRIARLYMVKGDKKKAEETLLKWVDQQRGYGGGGWMLREALLRLTEFELWDAAENFVKKHRSENLQQWEAQEFDRAVADQYVQHGRFGSIIDELLKQESFKGRDLELLKLIAQQMGQSAQETKRREFLEKVCAADPKNRELAMQLAEAYAGKPEFAEQRLAILKRLAEEDPNNTQYRTTYTQALINAGRAEEALEALAKWAAEKPVEGRYTLLAQQQKAAGRFREARASLERALQLADPTRKADLRVELAAFDAEHGEIEARKEALREHFETRKDANTFQQYLSCLDSSGYPAEAHALFLANKDAGYLDRYQGDNVLQVCFNQGDLQTPLELNWRFTRYTERWNRDDYFNRVSRLFADRGKAFVLVNDLHTRLANETNRNPMMQEKLAQAWERAGYPDKALAIYEQLIETSPFNRNAVNAKASLLVKLNRGDEAVALLRDPKGVASLNDEIEAKLQLATLLFKLKRPADADQEINDLLSWAKGGNVLERVGHFYFEQKEWAKAADAYEKSMRVARSWSYQQVLMNLGECYAKLGRGEDALKTWASIPPMPHFYGPAGAPLEWLLAEEIFDLAIQYAEAERAKRPEDPDLHSAVARALLKTGKTNEAFQTFARAAELLPPERHVQLRARLSDLLGDPHEPQLVAQALAFHATNKCWVFAGALVSLITDAPEYKERTERIVQQAKSFVVGEPELQVQLGEAFLRLKQTDAAAAWYRKALAATNETVRLSAARGLAHAGAGREAAPVLTAVLKTRPHDAVRALDLWSAVAKTGDATAIDLLTKIVTDSALHPTERDYFQALFTLYRGQTNEARALRETCGRAEAHRRPTPDARQLVP
jgi:tetratricopeptide (TPR) repeat protein